MRWIPLVILLYLCGALQVANLGALGGAAPCPRIEYLVLLAVFYALYAQEDVAPLAGLCCGILYDLTGPEPLGVYTLPLALVVVAVVRIRPAIFREHVVSQFVLPGAAVVAFAALAAVLRWGLTWVRGWPPDAVGSWSYVGHMTVNALYTGLVAPAAFWPLLRMRGFLGFVPHGPRSRSRGA